MFRTNTLTADIIAQYVANYNAGATLSSIAKQVGCSVPTIGRILKKNGADMRGKGRPKGSKTVNRKPKVAAVAVGTTVTEMPVIPGLPVESDKLAASSGSFADFQQRVLNYNS